MEGNPLRSPLTDEDGELPSADEIAAELENFLAIRRSGDDDLPAGLIGSDCRSSQRAFRALAADIVGE